MVEKEQKKERFETVELPTQTDVFIRDNEKDAVLTDREILSKILNDLELIKKNIA